jgi:hypothetical protein
MQTCPRHHRWTSYPDGRRRRCPECPRTITLHEPVVGVVDGFNAYVAAGTYELLERYIDLNHDEEAIVVQARAHTPRIKFYVRDLPARVQL